MKSLILLLQLISRQAQAALEVAAEEELAGGLGADGALNSSERGYTHFTCFTST